MNAAQGIRQVGVLAQIQSVALRLDGLPSMFPVGERTRETEISLGEGVAFRGRVAQTRAVTAPLCAFDLRDPVPMARITHLEIQEPPEFTRIALFLNGREIFSQERDRAQLVENGLRFTF